MSATHSHSHGLPSGVGWEQLAPGQRKGPKSGPANMASVQRRYGQTLRGVYGAISAEAKRAVVERDFFGLRSNVEQLSDSAFDPSDLTPSAFSPDDPATNHQEFMDWLHEEQRRGILETFTKDNNTYVRKASNRGVKYAEKELRKAGYDVDSEDVAAVFNRPAEANQLRLLFQRNYDQLEDVTADTASSISRVLSEGFGQGKNPTEIGRSITKQTELAKTRSTRIARYEVMNAHSTFTRRRYERAGVEKVEVLGSNPCTEICAPIIAGNPYPLGEVPNGGPPFHPNCVDCLSPVMV